MESNVNLPENGISAAESSPAQPIAPKEDPVTEKRKKKGSGCLPFIALILVALALPFIVFFMFFGSGTYAETTKFGDFRIMHGYYRGITKFLGMNHASVETYLFDGTEKKREIYLPDAYVNSQIRELGGYVGIGAPCGFRIEYRYPENSPEAALKKWAKTSYASDFSYVENDGVVCDEVVYDDFVLHIGKRIESIKSDTNSVHIFETHNGRKLAYVQRVYVICDEKNDFFYSADGVLYAKNGKRCEEFIYVGQELPTN